MSTVAGAALYEESAEEELRTLRAFEAQRILDEVDAQLGRTPMTRQDGENFSKV